VDSDLSGICQSQIQEAEIESQVLPWISCCTSPYIFVSQFETTKPWENKVQEYQKSPQKKRLTKQMKMKSGKRLSTNEFFLDKLGRCFPCTRYGSCNFFLIIVYDPLMLGCPCSLEADFFELSITRQLQISVL